jgi:hypothetical protein
MGGGECDRGPGGGEVVCAEERFPRTRLVCQDACYVH